MCVHGVPSPTFEGAFSLTPMLLFKDNVCPHFAVGDTEVQRGRMIGSRPQTAEWEPVARFVNSPACCLLFYSFSFRLQKGLQRVIPGLPPCPPRHPPTVSLSLSRLKTAHHGSSCLPAPCHSIPGLHLPSAQTPPPAALPGGSRRSESLWKYLPWPPWRLGACPALSPGGTAKEAGVMSPSSPGPARASAQASPQLEMLSALTQISQTSCPLQEAFSELRRLN